MKYNSMPLYCIKSLDNQATHVAFYIDFISPFLYFFNDDCFYVL